MGFALRHHVYGCIANERVALLDLVADRYYCVPPKAEMVIKNLIDRERVRIEPIEALHPLLSRGLLIETNVPGLRLTEIAVPTPTESVFDHEDCKVNVWSLGRSVSTRIASSINMNRRPVHRVIDEVSARKGEGIRRAGGDFEPDISAMAWSFIASRRIISKQDKCLPWSVAMVNYLSRFCFFPDLVIGVKMDPFAAHAWVQHRGLVLSDTAEAVLPYTPILAI